MFSKALVMSYPGKGNGISHSSILAWEIPWTEEPGGLAESDTTWQLNNNSVLQAPEFSKTPRHCSKEVPGGYSQSLQICLGAGSYSKVPGDGLGARQGLPVKGRGECAYTPQN